MTDLDSQDVHRRVAGLLNLVVFGRAVTNVLQNLRGSEPAFDSWYQPFVEEMRNDPLLRYFYKLRSQILKVGRIETGSSAYFEDFNFQRDRHLWGDAPEGAVGMFLKDEIGGAGWTIRLPDGTDEPYYVSLPERIYRSTLVLPDAPDEHRGTKLPDRSVQALGAAYCQYLESLVELAQERFLSRCA